MLTRPEHLVWRPSVYVCALPEHLVWRPSVYVCGVRVVLCLCYMYDDVHDFNINNFRPLLPYPCRVCFIFFLVYICILFEEEDDIIT